MRLWTMLLCAAMAVIAGAILGGIRKLPLRQMEWGLLLPRCGVAILIGADTGGLFLLAGQMLDRYRTDNWAGWLFAVGCVATAGLLLLHPVSLFPEEVETIILTERTQRGRFAACLWRLTAAFAFYGAWVIFLLRAAPFAAAPEAAAVFCFTAAAMLFLLWNGRQSVGAVYERIEALVERQYQAELLNFMQVIRSQRHDFNFHMQAVAGMIDGKRYDECSAYVREMVKNVERLNDVLPLKNPVISALLNAFRELAATRRVRLEVQVLSQLEPLPCTAYEMNSVLGNLLQNAIDEAEGKAPEERWIRLLIMKRSRRHIVKVSNPCGKTPEEYGNIFHAGYSTKQSHEGLGLVSVKKIVGRYGGTVYLEHDPGIVHFIVKIPEKMRTGE